MDTVTYPDPRVAEFVEGHFIPAKIVIKENPQLAKEHLVSWTPNVVILCDKGKLHSRIEGFFQPTDLLARLSLGLGRYYLNRKEFELAGERFQEVADRHAGSEAGAEALYWLGVAHYKASHDPKLLRSSWQRLAQEYPNSEWTKRSQIPSAK